MATPENVTEVSLVDFEARVRKLHEDLQAFRKRPGAWSVMRYYLIGKGHAARDIDAILSGVEEFMSKFSAPIPTKK